MNAHPRTTKADLTREADALRSRIASLRYAETLRPFCGLAWTGGCSPAKPSTLPRWTVAYRRALFREQANTHAAFWKCPTEWDTFRTFYRRAAGDAHATFRNAFNG